MNTSKKNLRINKHLIKLPKRKGCFSLDGIPLHFVYLLGTNSHIVFLNLGAFIL